MGLKYLVMRMMDAQHAHGRVVVMDSRMESATHERESYVECTLIDRRHASINNPCSVDGSYYGLDLWVAWIPRVYVLLLGRG